MRLLILWAGIVAFVWIGVNPPMVGKWSPGPARGMTYSIDITTEEHVDIGALLGRWGVVVALAGGLLYTESRLRPWLCAHRRVILGTTLAVLALLLIYFNAMLIGGAR